MTIDISNDKMEHVDNDIEQSITEFIDEQLNNSN